MEDPGNNFDSYTATGIYKSTSKHLKDNKEVSKQPTWISQKQTMLNQFHFLLRSWKDLWMDGDGENTGCNKTQYFYTLSHDIFIN